MGGIHGRHFLFFWQATCRVRLAPTRFVFIQVFSFSKAKGTYAFLLAFFSNGFPLNLPLKFFLMLEIVLGDQRVIMMHPAAVLIRRPAKGDELIFFLFFFSNDGTVCLRRRNGFEPTLLFLRPFQNTSSEG